MSLKVLYPEVLNAPKISKKYSNQQCAVQIYNDTGQNVDLLWGRGRHVRGGSPPYSHDPQRNRCAGGYHFLTNCPPVISVQSEVPFL